MTIGGVAATSVNVTSDTTLTATTPADGSPPTPTVNAYPGGISPNYGPTSGGTAVTINGTGFGHYVDVVVNTSSGSGTGSGVFLYNDVAQVSIGGTTASSFTFVSTTELTLNTPSGVPGVGNVIVVNENALSSGSTGNNEYAYIQGGPSITSIGPDFGLINVSGNQVIITGGNFVPYNWQNGNPATTVTFSCNGSPVTATSSSSNVTSITATVPSCGTAGASAVKVTLPDGSNTTAYYQYVAPQQPVVTSITNTNGSSPYDGQAKGTTQGGDQVSISGSNFTGATVVSIGGTNVTSFSVTAPGTITTTTPPGTAGTASVSVTVPQASPSTGTGTNIFTYVPPVPQVLSVTPQTGSTLGGYSVVITGSGFTNATQVAFGSSTVSCPSTSCTVKNDGEVDVVAPSASSAGSVEVKVTTPGGTSSAPQYGSDTFTYVLVPTVTSLNPSSGPATGGTVVKVMGTNFTSTSTVKFGSTAAAAVAYVSANEVDATSPVGSGTVDITVSSGGSSPLYSATSAADKYTFIGPPVVYSVSPNSGTTAGGTAVTISGASFTGVTGVTFGGTAVTNLAFVNDSTLTANTPAGTAGTASVVVTTSNGHNAANTLYTYYPPPTVGSLSPSGGPAGTSVTITGTGFSGQITLSFGSTQVTHFSVNSSTSITATAPPGTGAVTVTVTTPGGSVNAGTFTYTGAPTVTGISPSTGPASGGTSVIITGSNFIGTTAVNFGGTVASSFTVNSATQITAKAPAGSNVVDVTVTTPQGTSATSGADQFTYTSAPVVTAVSPASGLPAGGATVTISGSFFLGVTSVKFGTSAATNVTVNGAGTSITATAPSGTGSVDVTVTTAQGTSAIVAADKYTYEQAPVVTSILPTSGPAAGGTSVTITGNNFTGATAVNFGNTAATIGTISANSIVVTSPPGTGVADVTVVTGVGTSATSAADKFTYISPPPTVTGVSPNTGPTAGGNTVTITGTNFTGYGSVTVKFGSVSASISSVASTSIMAIVPAGAAATVDVTVNTTAGGTSATSSADQYTYTTAPPTVTSVTPNVGIITGGATVAITGTNFTGVSSVKFGTASASFTFNSPTSITATSPAGTGTVDVTVTTPNGTSTTSSSDNYTYNTGPVVTSVSPNTGSGSTSVTITGTGFSGATSVSFGGTPATPFSVNLAGTSITTTAPAGTGTIDVTVTTPSGTSASTTFDKFTYGTTTPSTSLTPTTMNLTSSPNPSYYHQPVTFTATVKGSVTGHAPTGIVTFTEGGVQIGTGTLVPIASTTSSAATFVISTLPIGSDAVKASYPGDSYNAADPESITQVVNAPADSVKLHQLQLEVMSVETTVSAAAITGAIDSAIGAGFSGTCSGAPTPNGSGFTYCFSGGATEPPPRPVQQTLPPPPPIGVYSGPPSSGTIVYPHGTPGVSPYTSGQANPAGGSAGQVALGGTPTPASVSGMPMQLTNRARVDQEFQALNYDSTPPGPYTLPGTAPPAAAASPPPPLSPARLPQSWLAWVDVRGSELERTSSTSDLKGLQGNAMAGVTRRVTPNFLVGAAFGYENFNYSSQAYNGVLRGQGVTTGAYLGWHFLPSMRLEVAGTWSDIFASDTSGTASGNFTGTRWLAFGNLTGNFDLRGFAFEPSAQVYTLWEHENSYTDSLGTLQPNHDFDTGRASGGLKVSHAFPVGSSSIAPYAGIYGDYYFTVDSSSQDLSLAGVAAVPVIQGWAGRATGGVTATLRNGAQVGVGGEFSGIGNSTQIWTLNLRGSVPF